MSKVIVLTGLELGLNGLEVEARCL
jgi:hypothetical protein